MTTLAPIRPVTNLEVLSTKTNTANWQQNTLDLLVNRFGNVCV